MELGFFARNGRLLTGRLGPLHLSWDRHRGGLLNIAYCLGARQVPVGHFSLAVRLAGGGTVHAHSDPDPRLLPVEAGTTRLVLRAVQRLADPQGRHCADAMQESWAWMDGDLHLSAMLRLVEGRPAADAARAELALAPDWNVEQRGESGLFLRAASGLWMAVLWRQGCPWALPVDGQDPWEALGGYPPYYRRWGPYYDQWGGRAGWDGVAEETASLLCFHWHASAGGGDATPAFRGTLALRFAADRTALQAKAIAFAQPLAPLVEGGRVLYHSPLDGATLIRCDNPRSLRLAFPADAHQRLAKVLVCGLEERRPRRTEGVRTAQSLARGGVSDDPNGPDLLRPDDPHGPLLTDERVWPDELVFATPLSAAGETLVRIDSPPGLQVAYQQWDERQNLLLFSSAHPGSPLLSLSLRDLKARNLRIPGSASITMARLPLYWFQANASSAHHCLNVPERIEMLEDGPEAVHLSLCATNPARTARSLVEVRIPFAQEQLRLELRCVFEALEEWNLPGIQYCNFFPEEKRLPENWNADRLLVAAADGRRMRIDPRAHRTLQIEDGALFQQYTGALFVALYGGPRGHVFALSRPHLTGPATPAYQLCACWLDNHLYLSSEGASLPAGTRFEMELTLVMSERPAIDTDVEALARQALESGRLDL